MESKADPQAGSKRKRRPSDSEQKRKRKKKVSIAEGDAIKGDTAPKEVPATDFLAPVEHHRKSLYEIYSQSKNFQPAEEEPLITHKDIMGDNLELWLFQFPKNVSDRSLFQSSGGALMSGCGFIPVRPKISSWKNY